MAGQLLSSGHKCLKPVVFCPNIKLNFLAAPAGWTKSENNLNVQENLVVDWCSQFTGCKCFSTPFSNNLKLQDYRFQKLCICTSYLNIKHVGVIWNKSNCRPDDGEGAHQYGALEEQNGQQSEDPEQPCNWWHVKLKWKIDKRKLFSDVRFSDNQILIY